MNQTFKKLAVSVAIIALISTVIFIWRNGDKTYIPLTLEGKVLSFAAKYMNRDCIVISKSKHLFYYCNDGYIVRDAKFGGFDLPFPTPIAIGMGGKYETPCGEYYICQKNPNSRFTLFLGLSWPNIADANKAIELGQRLSNYDYRRIVTANVLRTQVPWDTPLGGTYGIHGAATYLKYAIDKMEKANPNLIYVTKRDNTRGCIALEHRFLKYLYAKVNVGTPVLILN